MISSKKDKENNNTSAVRDKNKTITVLITSFTIKRFSKNYESESKTKRLKNGLKNQRSTRKRRKTLENLDKCFFLLLFNISVRKTNTLTNTTTPAPSNHITNLQDLTRSRQDHLKIDIKTIIM